MNDTTIVRSAAELERKYNLSKLAGLSNNVETNNNELIKIQNELTNMLNTLIINLGDVLDDNISLWFYPGIPNTLNEPYISWSDPTEHIGDIYYDQNSGNVYKYKNEGWIQNKDTNLISAMALTNAELDVSEDHERKVYLSQPIPPYDSGDWWILEDGSLKICQLGKKSGEYDENDFVVSSKYTTTLATKQNDAITVLKGTVTEITEDYVKYTDLATGGSTTIAGENINTGIIKSNNYIPDTSGMSINLNNGIINSKNFKLDNVGNVDIGGYITTNKGILTNLSFMSNWYPLGYNFSGREGPHIERPKIRVFCHVPPGFEVVKAFCSLHLFKTENSFPDLTSQDGAEINDTGKVHNIKLYKMSKMGIFGNYLAGYGEVFIDDGAETEVITSTGINPFGENGFTSPTIEASSNDSLDFANIFKNEDGETIPGTYTFILRTTDPDLEFNNANLVTAAARCQYGFVTINIIGHLALNE